MTTLAIFVHSLFGGGAERAMVNLARGFSQRGIPVDLVLLRVEGAYLDQVPPEVRIVDLGGRRLIASLPTLVRYLQRERPAVLLSSLEEVTLAALWSRAIAGVSTRLVVNVQNTISVESQNATNWKIRIIPNFVRWFFPWADAIVPVSEGVAEDLRQMGLPGERIQVIHNPVVTPDLIQRATEPVDHPWFQPGQPPVLIAVGRLLKQKDFPTLLHMFAQVRQQRPARLMILGEGDDRAELEQLAQQLGIAAEVAMPGFVDNPFAYVSKAAVFVLSSIFEGLPTVLIEALAVGTPVVATDCKSGPMEILQGGQYGKLVPVGDVVGLAAAVLDTLEHPPDSSLLQQRASEYSLERSLDDYSQVLQVLA
jgi:glycosyltransferase involved in cell wall biosynthesis